MSTSISTIAVEEKNKIATDSLWYVALKIIIPGVTDPIRVIRANSDVSWGGDGSAPYLWVAFPFEIDEIGDTSKGEVPQINVRVSNVSRAMEVYLEAYDDYCKLNGFSPIEVYIYALNSKAITPISVTSIVHSGVDGKTATVTCPNNHKLTSGQEVYIYGASPSDFNGTYEISVTGAKTFTYTLSSHPASDSGACNAQNYTPEVEHYFELKTPSADSKWATFVLGASNPFIRRFPQSRVLKNVCRFKFDNSDGRCGYSGTTWAASTHYSVGRRVKPTAASIYCWECTTEGTSAAGEPAWTGSTQGDGTVVWTRITKDSTCVKQLGDAVKWVKGTVYAVGDKVRATPTVGFTYECTTGGTSGASAPAFSESDTPDVTTYNDNGVIWTCRKEYTCREKGNSKRFGGFPGVGYGGFASQ